ncbi:hypothetical protein E1295_14910 [Nonomuraea mesophila]|uniref:Uncharacterized protein n=1 Tax=Nonomuraea mesophila TaxID=2530382 RepID=A0A4R5FPJ9_9ACTN|nr:hypothetical protein [Nonomuraea mesophila]TDE54557.1 hypothetical protein E1295_14910 [Nonomuraea mesophila]
MLGWIIGPVFSGGGDETLRPEFFSLVGLPPARLAGGLLVSASVGVAPVGVATDALCYWGLGLLAERRLTAQGPELLHMMRTGRRPGGGGGTAYKLPDMPKVQRAVVMTCWSLGAIPLFPQGIVAGIFLANGMLEHSWFVATYMPAGLRWPTVVEMTLIGAAMYGTGLWLTLRAKRRAEAVAGP